MALKIEKLCKCCQIILAEVGPTVRPDASRLYKKITLYMTHKLTYASIERLYPDISRANLSLHTRKHQTLTPRSKTAAGIEEANIDELKAEVVQLRERVFGIEQTKSDINKLTEWLMAQVEAGNVKPSLGPLVNLVGKAAAIHEKEVDQGISMMGLMAKYASGEKQPEELDAP